MAVISITGIETAPLKFSVRPLRPRDLPSCGRFGGATAARYSGFYFVSDTPGTGCATGVRDGVQTVWLPVARSQKARFASRKRIKARRRQPGRVSKPLLIYIPVVRATRSLANASISNEARKRDRSN